MKIIKNSIITPDGIELRSYHRHDYQSYIDNNGNYYSVDGGTDYLKRGFKIKNYIENSVYSDGTFELERTHICWGRNYDENMKRLPKTEFVPIKDLNTDHIWAILLTLPNMNKEYRRVMEEEIFFREEEWYNNN